MTCTRCECHQNKFHVNCISYSGNANPDFYFLGEQAGFNEAKASQEEPTHFIGKSGQIFDNLLELIDINREDVAIANSLRCWKLDNKTPTEKELDACFIFTYKEIKKLKPKIVIALGGVALYQTLGKQGIEKYAGRLLWSDKLKCKVYPVFHPASIKYTPNRKEKFLKDFKRIPSLLTSEVDDFPKVYPYTLIDTDEKFNSIYHLLLGNQISFDIEADGLDPYDESLKFRSLQVGKSEEDIYVIQPQIIESNVPKLKELFDICPVTGQDFAFDAKWLFVKYGIFPKIWENDTCLAEYILTGFKNNDLNFLTGKYNPDYVDYWEKVSAVGGAHKIESKEELYSYGASDVGTLFPIIKKQYKSLVRDSMSNIYDNITLPCNKVLTKMSLRGVLYDLDHLKKIDKEYEVKANKAFAKIADDEGVIACEKHFRRKFNPRSSQMVHWLLLEHYRLPVINTNKDNNPTLGIEEMKRYAKGKYKNKYCKIMVNYRSLQNIRNNFLSGVVPKLVNGVAHTNYSLHSTATGRSNSTNPNLLNIPREKSIKKCIISRPGYQFICSDQAQLEVRIAAVVYDEPELIKICNDKMKDMHCSITAKAFNRDYDEIYNGYKNGDIKITELRVRGKSTAFGIIYQEGAAKLAYALNITEKKAQKFIDDYYKNFPSLKQNIEITKEILVEQGYLNNYFNFRRRWKDHTKEAHASLREGVNFLVQSLAWNLLQMSLIKIDEELEKRNLKSRLVLQVYDSVIVESKNEEVDEVANIVKEIMESANRKFENINRVKLLADVEVGPNLADLKKIL